MTSRGCGRAATLSLAAALSAACDDAAAPSDRAPPPSAGAAEARSAAAPPAKARIAASPAPRAPVGCRALSVSGAVALAAGDPVSKGAWLEGRAIELGPGARVHLKHGASGREWTLEGPARAHVCADGREEIALGSGTLRAELGAGARPGAEVLVGTPFGTLRYTDARGEIRASARELVASLAAGEMWLASAAPNEADAPIAVARPARRSAKQKLTAEAALAACERAAQAAESETQELLAPGGGATGARAASQVRARRLAGSVCLSARAALLEQASGAELERDLQRVEEYRALSLRIPAPR